MNFRLIKVVLIFTLSFLLDQSLLPGGLHLEKINELHCEIHANEETESGLHAIVIPILNRTGVANSVGLTALQLCPFFQFTHLLSIWRKQIFVFRFADFLPYPDILNYLRFRGPPKLDPIP